MPAIATAPGSGTTTNCVTEPVVTVPPEKSADDTLATDRLTPVTTGVAVM